MDTLLAAHDEILDNIDGRMHGPMNQFIEKHFGHFQYIHQDGLLKIQPRGRASSQFAIPPAAPSPDDFLHWFSQCVSGGLDGARGAWHIHPAESGDAEDGARVLFTITPSPASKVETEWDHVQVVGQFYQNGYVCYRNGLVELCRSAYQVFARQPTRLFLHGFYIRGSLIEFWVFDRSGLYCSEVFHTQNDLVQFLSVILSYQRMTDQELGKSDLIQIDDGGSYIAPDSIDGTLFGKALSRQPTYRLSLGFDWGWNNLLQG
ncbi:hypothetical protein RRF57_005676 [Xylaria bambusicola]|uniref:Fungal-type protein kinase domain-containing protein n=1 Tax=Xylaria bambusicola TaxID=326684 RepID=A0AAN7Z9E5_9PEZI